MKKLQCELCGSIDIIKVAPDVFQCQYCGCKYTAEQAKTIIKGEVVSRAPEFEIVGGELVKYSGSSTDVVLPKGVVIIGEKVFAGSAIKRVVVTDDVVEIKNSAFGNCKYLEEVQLPNTIVRIDDSAFSGCEHLERIQLPDSLEVIGEGAFRGNKSLKAIKWPENLKHIGLLSFEGCVGLKELKLPNGIQMIDRGAFSNCSGLSEVVITGGNVGACAFEGCSNLKRIVLKSRVETVGNAAFWNCNEVSEFIIEPGVKELGENVCESPKLHSVYIPDGTFYYNDYWHYKSSFDKYNVRYPNYEEKGKCARCGGDFKGVFNKVCSNCGNPKDY